MTSRQSRPDVTGSILALCDSYDAKQEKLSAIRGAAVFSNARLEGARDLLAGRSLPGLHLIALGSYGRGDASACSDLDLACIYDPERCSQELAQAGRQSAIEVLGTNFEIPDKTFKRPMDQQSMLASIGGSGDSNTSLTHRALLLTEGTWLTDEAEFRALYRATFAAYTRGEVTRGRTRGALANELNRYYRTVCVDFRHKVEVHEKAWALRVLKLRHSRKLWHLGNMCLHLWASLVPSRGREIPETAHEELMEHRLVWPSLCKVALLLQKLGLDHLGLDFLTLYDNFLAAAQDPACRETLEHLRWEDREHSADFVALRDNADQLDNASVRLIEEAWTDIRATLVRFWLL